MKKIFPVIIVLISLSLVGTIYVQYNWLGVKIYNNKNIAAEDLHIQQWEPYDHPSTLPLKDALCALLQWMENCKIDLLITRTSLLIAPSYTFRVVDILITNFHQPRSTLLLLVAAFIGKDWKSVYTYALENGFRFLSYGDSCLLFRQ